MSRKWTWAIHLEGQWNVLPGKLSGETHREADGEEDRVTAGGGIRDALYN